MPDIQTVYVQACRRCDAGKSPVDIPSTPCGHERDANAIGLSVDSLMLDEQEWEDLVDMVNHFLLCTRWVEYEERTETPATIEVLLRKRELAEAILELQAALGSQG